MLVATILYKNTVIDFDPATTRLVDRHPVTAGQPASVATIGR